MPGILDGQPNLLLACAVSQATLDLYTGAIAKFCDFCDARGVEVDLKSDPELVDSAAADFCAEMCFGTKDKKPVNVALGMHLKAGLLNLHPGMRLPQLSRAVKSWERLKLGKEGEGFSEEVWALLLDYLAGESLGAFGVAAAAVDLYLRGDDWAQIRASDLSASRVGGKWTVAVELGVVVRGETTKTGSNQGVVVRRPWVAALLGELKERAKKGGKLFPISRPDFGRHWTAAVARLGLESVVGSPHSMRHAGATIDFHAGVPLAEIKLRGRWESDKSVSRYTKAHVLARCNSHLSPTLARRAKELLADPQRLVDRALARSVDNAPKPCARRPLANLTL